MTHDLDLDQILRVVDQLQPDHVKYHTELQIDRFILLANSAGTEYGAYKQALREVVNRRESLEKLMIDVEELEDELATSRTRWWWRAARRRAHGREMRRLQLRLDRTRDKAKETERELRHFVMRAGQLKDRVGELTPSRRRELDLQFWVNGLLLRAALEMQVDGTVKLGTLRTAAALPPNARKTVFDALDSSRAASELKRWLLERPQLLDTDDVASTTDSFRGSPQTPHSQADATVGDSPSGC